jgi:hypothetical protein
VKDVVEANLGRKLKPESDAPNHLIWVEVLRRQFGLRDVVDSDNNSLVQAQPDPIAVMVLVVRRLHESPSL